MTCRSDTAIVGDVTIKHIGFGGSGTKGQTTEVWTSLQEHADAILSGSGAFYLAAAVVLLFALFFFVGGRLSKRGGGSSESISTSVGSTCGSGGGGKIADVPRKGNDR